MYPINFVDRRGLQALTLRIDVYADGGGDPDPSRREAHPMERRTTKPAKLSGRCGNPPVGCPVALQKQLTDASVIGYFEGNGFCYGFGHWTTPATNATIAVSKNPEMLNYHATFRSVICLARVPSLIVIAMILIAYPGWLDFADPAIWSVGFYFAAWIAGTVAVIVSNLRVADLSISKRIAVALSSRPC